MSFKSNLQDLIDTSPTVLTDKTNVLFESIELGINERGEIVLAPDKPMRGPTLYMKSTGSEVIVENVIHGRSCLPHVGPWPVELFRMGLKQDVTVTKDEPLKIVIVNRGPEQSSVGASLVSNP